jgi:hypothetical protein
VSNSSGGRNLWVIEIRIAGHHDRRTTTFIAGRSKREAIDEAIVYLKQTGQLSKGKTTPAKGTK